MASWFKAEYQNANVSERERKISRKNTRNFLGRYNLLLTLWRSQTGSKRFESPISAIQALQVLQNIVSLSLQYIRLSII